VIPSFRGLLVVDAEGFSRHRDAELPSLHAEIRRVVECACERCGLHDTWQGARVLQSTGDGLFAVLPHEAIVALIHPFADRLQDLLAEAAPRLRASGLGLRLRVALHAGLVDDEHPVTAGISNATNEVHRLLDCGPVREALRASDPDVTFTAVILSSEAFELFVRGGHTGLQPSQFTKVRAKVKQFDRTAYLYVPAPSTREPADESQPDTAQPAQVPPPGALSIGQVSVTGDAAQNVIGSQVQGSIRQKRS
jgi:hypothetical protein